MERIADWLVEPTRAVSDAKLDREAAEGDVTLELERETLGAALSTLDPAVRAAIGVAEPRTRADIDRVATALLRAGL